MLEIVTKVIGWIIRVIPISIILRPRPRTYASTSPLLLLQLHQQQQLLSIINIINSTNHHLHHAKLRILLQHLTSHAAYERSGGPLIRTSVQRTCLMYHGACKVEFQPFNRSYSQLTFFNVLLECLRKYVFQNVLL